MISLAPSCSSHHLPVEKCSPNGSIVGLTPQLFAGIIIGYPRGGCVYIDAVVARHTLDSHEDNC